jgi:ABC-type spermidine/putrescine transport system permease subunit II
MPSGRAARLANWAFIALIVAFLYLPMVPPPLFSISEGGSAAVLDAVTLRWYAEIWRNPVLVQAMQVSFAAALVTAIAAPLLGLLAAMAVRELGVPRLVLMLVLVPLFIPGVSMGLATAFLFRLLDLPPSFLSICLVHILWALPFATLIILTVMANFDPVYLEAAYMHGANRWRAFRTVELPLIWPGVTGAATFSMILSFNETVRTSLVQGPFNTVQTYIWSTYRQVGLSPTLYALMSLLILLTILLVVLFVAAEARQKTS